MSLGKYKWIGAGDGEFVVDFTSRSSGTVVSSLNPYRPVGYQGSDWGCFSDPRYWEKVEEQPERKAFGQLTQEEQIALATAYIQGKTVYVTLLANGTAYPMTSLNFHDEEYYEVREPEPVIPDSIDWNAVADEYRYITTDGTGSILWIQKPSFEGIWEMLGPGSNKFIDALTFKSFVRGTTSFKDAIVERPK